MSCLTGDAGCRRYVKTVFLWAKAQTSRIAGSIRPSSVGQSKKISGIRVWQAACWAGINILSTIIIWRAVGIIFSPTFMWIQWSGRKADSMTTTGYGRSSRQWQNFSGAEKFTNLFKARMQSSACPELVERVASQRQMARMNRRSCETECKSS